MKFAIVANPKKYEVKEVLANTIKWASKNGIILLINKDTFQENKLEDAAILKKTSSDEESIDGADIVIVMGGDGTILYTARISKHDGKPIIGINSGRLGFMANTQKDDLERALNDILSGNYTLDKRAYLKATTKEGTEHFALNEFLFTRKDSTSMVTVTAEYGGSLINT